MKSTDHGWLSFADLDASSNDFDFPSFLSVSYMATIMRVMATARDDRQLQ
jgi:hypothetical protein